MVCFCLLKYKLTRFVLKTNFFNKYIRNVWGIVVWRHNVLSSKRLLHLFWSFGKHKLFRTTCYFIFFFCTVDAHFNSGHVKLFQSMLVTSGNSLLFFLRKKNKGRLHYLVMTRVWDWCKIHACTHWSVIKLTEIDPYLHSRRDTFLLRKMRCFFSFRLLLIFY